MIAAAAANDVTRFEATIERAAELDGESDREAQRMGAQVCVGA